MEFLTPVRMPIIGRINQSIFYFIFVILIVGVESASSPLPAALLAGEDCAGEIVRFSTCLPYVSSYPNNISAFASSACCESFSSAFRFGDGFCFCYLLRQPLILGFPVNTTRILSLNSVCAPANASSVTNTSLESFCGGSPALPPLHSGTIGPAFTNPNAPSVPAESGSPSTSNTPPPEVADGIHAPLKAPESLFSADGHSSRYSFSFYSAAFWVGFMLSSTWFSCITHLVVLLGMNEFVSL